MSFRDLRNLSELLRKIGYPRLISLENFRNPNFKLVAEICMWLIKQYEPDADDSMHSTETEQDRVRFVTYFAEFMLKHIQIKLNTKRLYQADGYAVKELIKVAIGLDQSKSTKVNFNNGEDKAAMVAEDEEDSGHFELGNNIEELRRTRNLGLEITQRGGSLYDLLSKEITLRDARYKALSKAFELDEVERVLQAAIKASAVELSKSETMLENVFANVGAVQLKIDKKHSELERSEKRLSTLKKVRPAFMDEYEKLQGDLEKCYREYVVRFRVLSCLQNQVEEMTRLDTERKAEERLIKQELATTDDLLLYHHRAVGGKSEFLTGRGGYGDDEEDEDDDDDEDENSEENSIQYNAREFMLSRGGSLSRMTRPQESSQGQLRTAGKKDRTSNGPIPPSKASIMNNGGKGGRKSAAATNGPSAKPKQMYGNIMNGDDDDDDDETESDALLLEDDNLDQSEMLSDDIDDDDDDDDEIDDDLLEMGGLELTSAPVPPARNSSNVSGPTVQTARKPKSYSNDDNANANKTYRKESRYGSGLIMTNGGGAGAEASTIPSSTRSSKSKTIQPTPPAPSSSTVTVYDNDDGDGSYRNIANTINKYTSDQTSDKDLVVPNGIGFTHLKKPHQEISFINEEVDGFGDSSLTKPLEAPKTSISSLTYRKSSKTKLNGHHEGGRRASTSGAGSSNAGSANFGLQNGGSSNEVHDENKLISASSSRKKSSSVGAAANSSSKGHRRSESSGSSRSSSSSKSHHRPESKSKSSKHSGHGHAHQHGSSNSSNNHHPVVEEEQELDDNDFEYAIPEDLVVERPTTRPSSHYTNMDKLN